MHVYILYDLLEIENARPTHLIELLNLLKFLRLPKHIQFYRMVILLHIFFYYAVLPWFFVFFVIPVQTGIHCCMIKQFTKRIPACYIEHVEM